MATDYKPPETLEQIERSNDKNKTEDDIINELTKLTSSFNRLYDRFFKCPAANSRKNACTPKSINNFTTNYLFNTEDQYGSQNIDTLKEFMLEFVADDGMNWEFKKICKQKYNRLSTKIIKNAKSEQESVF